MIDNPLNRLDVRRGEDLPHSKLTEEDVLRIRRLVWFRNELKQVMQTMTNRAIAQDLGVHQRTVDRVTAGENWTHVGFDI